jgi:hypothetical protein
VITRKRITGNAHDPARGMTLDEIAAWLDYARASGGRGNDIARVVVNRHHGLKVLSVDIIGDPADLDDATRRLPGGPTQ